MDSYQVSIIIPVYNSEETIVRCILSAIRQTHEKIEIICINDGSTDRSLTSLQALADIDRRIVVISQSNGGVSSARNAGLDVATGDFVIFLDSDDYLEPTLVADFLEEVSPELDFLMEIGNRKPKKEIVRDYRKFIAWGLRNSLLNPPWGKLYRRRIIEENRIRFREGVSLGEDLLFNVEYSNFTDEFRLIKGSRYRFEANAGSLTRSYRPSKYAELMQVHDSLAEAFSLVQDESIWSTLVYLRVKAVLSAASSLYDREAGFSRVERNALLQKMARENPASGLREGDLVMRIITCLYARLGLIRTERIVRCGRRLYSSITGFRK